MLKQIKYIHMMACNTMIKNHVFKNYQHGKIQ